MTHCARASAPRLCTLRAAAREGRPRLSPRSSRERYTVAETNLQQFMEIIGGVVPLLILSATGFENNGGCSCGCGVACDADYLLVVPR